MFSKYLLWLILSRLTGSPFATGVGLLLLWFVTDRFTLGVLPDPLRWVWRWQRERRLAHLLAQNPHDGRARLEWATLLVERRSYSKAVEVLKPVLARGDHEVNAVFVMGTACLGAGYHQQGEQLLDKVLTLSPAFRHGEAHLWLGRWRLARQDFAGAREALEQFVAERRGTVEGRVLLARALRGLGDDGAAALVEDQAWTEYVSSPSFHRRRERRWAWRAKPTRPLTYALVTALVLVLLGLSLGTLAPPLGAVEALDG
jgi:tetratricopeptide (TPR) repeat protein